MTPIECFQEFVALKAHFSGGYDYFKYNGKINASTLKSFDTHQDKWRFEKLSRHRDPRGVMIAHLARNPKTWVGDLIKADAEDAYKDWARRIESLTHTFVTEITPMIGKDFTSVRPGGSFPLIVVSLMGELISLETFTVALHLTGCERFWADQLLVEVGNRARKYAPFLKIDADLIRRKLRENVDIAPAMG